MSRRSRVVVAMALAVIGLSAIGSGFYGQSPALQAAGFADTGLDLVKVLVWGGIVTLVLSALLFISASAE